MGPFSHPWRYIAVTSSRSVCIPSAHARSSSHWSHSHSHVVSTARCRWSGSLARIASYSSAGFGGLRQPQQICANRPSTVIEFLAPVCTDLAYDSPSSSRLRSSAIGSSVNRSAGSTVMSLR